MSWLEQIGTVSFDPSWMRERLFFGRIELVWNELTQQHALVRRYDCPSELCLAEWVCFIPEPFKKVALEKACEVSRTLIREKATQHTIEIFISYFQDKVREAYACEYLTREGWVSQ